MTQSGSDRLTQAALWKRICALVIDWLLAMGIAAGFFEYDAVAILAIFAGMRIIMLILLGGSMGHIIMGIGVRTEWGARPGPLRMIGRTVLLCLVIPAILTMPEGRGYHDALVGTVPVEVR